MTRLIDFEELDTARLACFGSLVRALRFLGGQGPSGRVYPPPRATPLEMITPRVRDRVVGPNVALTEADD